MESENFHQDELPIDQLSESGQEKIEHEKSLEEVDLVHLCELIRKYNDRFLVVYSNYEDENDRQNEEQVAIREYESILNQYEKDLNLVGLKLELDEYKMITLSLKSGPGLLTYLDVLKEKKLSQDEIEMLSTLLLNFETQLLLKYDFNNLSNDEIELIVNFKKIIKKYRDFNETDLEDEIKIFAEYLNAKEGGYLKEKVLAEQEGFLFENVADENYPLGEFFHIYTIDLVMDRDRHRENWGNIIDKVREIGKNKNAQELQKKVIENLKSRLRKTKRNLKNTKFEDYKSKISKEEYEVGIQEYYLLLDDFYEELEVLEEDKKND